MLEVIRRKLVLLVIYIHSFLKTYVWYISQADRISLMNHSIGSDISQFVRTRAFSVNKCEFFFYHTLTFSRSQQFCKWPIRYISGKSPSCTYFLQNCVCFLIDLFQLLFQRDLPLKLDLFVSWLSISIFLRENVTEGISTGTIQLFLWTYA